MLGCETWTGRCCAKRAGLAFLKSRSFSVNSRNRDYACVPKEQRSGLFQTRDAALSMYIRRGLGPAIRHHLIQINWSLPSEHSASLHQHAEFCVLLFKAQALKGPHSLVRNWSCSQCEPDTCCQATMEASRALLVPCGAVMLVFHIWTC